MGELVNGQQVVGTTVTLVIHHAVTDPQEPQLNKAHDQACYTFASEHLHDSVKLGRKFSGQLKPRLCSLVSTGPTVFGERRILSMIQKSPSPQSDIKLKTHVLGLFFCYMYGESTPNQAHNVQMHVL